MTTTPDIAISDQLAAIKAALDAFRVAGDRVDELLDAFEGRLREDTTGTVAALVHDAGATGPQQFDTDWWAGLDDLGRAAVAAAWHDESLNEYDVVPPRPIRLPDNRPRRWCDPQPVGEILPDVIRGIAERDPNAPQWAREIGDD